MSAPEALVQGSIEWKLARLGKVGASSIADLTAKTKSGWGASRANLMARLISEILTGSPADSYTNAAMQWGTDTEPQARAAYAFRYDVDVREVGWVPHPTIDASGASPDGLCGDDGLVEFKCPNTATHIETLLGGAFDRKYVLQVQWQMAVTGRKWADLCSFDPRMPERMRMFVQRIKRDDAVIAELTKDVRQFIAERDEMLEQLKVKFGEQE